MKSKLRIPNEVYAVLEDEIKSYNISDSKVCSNLFDDALDVIEKYEKATNANAMPVATDIGRACHWLLLLSNQMDNEKHWKTVIKLLSPSSGVSLFQIKDSVLEIRNDSQAIINNIVDKQQRQQSTEFDLF
ncbi:hypothetical protein [Cronobacter sakazakii]|uniref:hypothetical protein n=1 Tax=Cronobacter sakazakii TaxID=28141 RepID=UPI0015C57757|nr:hypothetical protein [Cronobacter sakazakii]